MPFRGAWTARCELTTDDAPSGLVALALEGLGEWVATVKRVTDTGGRISVWLVGGRGGLAKEIKPQSFRNASLRLLLNRAIKEGGEKSDPEIEKLTEPVAQWVRVAGTCGAELDDLCDVYELDWGVTSDGEVWVGKYDWELCKVPTSIHATQRPFEPIFDFTDLVDVWPGQMIGPRRVLSVRHCIQVGKTQTTIYTDG